MSRELPKAKAETAAVAAVVLQRLLQAPLAVPQVASPHLAVESGPAVQQAPQIGKLVVDTGFQPALVRSQLALVRTLA